MVDRLFVDADHFVAVANKTDKNYGRALRLSSLATQAQIPFIATSSYSLGEAITVISQRVGHQPAVKFAHALAESDLIIIDVSREQREAGLLIFEEQKSKNVSFTDCVNMALMRELGIDTILSFDEDYKKNGFIRFGIDGEVKLSGQDRD